MKEKTLLFSVTRDQCIWQNFTVGGHGGSGKDTSNTGVRCIHKLSGAVGEGREERSQLANRQSAFRKMAGSTQFKVWLKMETARRLGQPSVEALVDNAMRDSNLRVEVKNNSGNWEAVV